MTDFPGQKPRVERRGKGFDHAQHFKQTKN